MTSRRDIKEGDFFIVVDKKNKFFLENYNVYDLIIE